MTYEEVKEMTQQLAEKYVSDPSPEKQARGRQLIMHVELLGHYHYERSILKRTQEDAIGHMMELVAEYIVGLSVMHARSLKAREALIFIFMERLMQRLERANEVIPMRRRN